MHHRLTRCLLAAAGAVASVASPALAQGDATTACKTAVDAFEAAVGSGDPAKVAAQFTADGVLTVPEGIFEGKQAITAYSSAFVKPGASDVDTVKTARAINGGNVVVCSGGWTLTFAPGSPMKEATGTWTKVLAKSGNKWRLEQLTYSYTPPPAPPKPRQESRAR